MPSTFDTVLPVPYPVGTYPVTTAPALLSCVIAVAHAAEAEEPGPDDGLMLTMNGTLGKACFAASTCGSSVKLYSG